ncbi:sigma factor-like helix-turn-helix DNA-binding protein [Streptomyces sp. NRRL B-24572]|uniref:sigma factor-like helix-turn-helix DNA-binding protein n=1 Tax=Streptomyces sp. NRRL B-24572 TaxID=1962156 RepID=UPI000A390D7F|nr:sigma factor-like helix-turn-helix DNA-binding protein [Streptomyces sp. NRRL B-24572]
MREQRRGRSAEHARRNREFEAFVAGAAGRLLHAATLLTAETRARNPYAQALLTAALAHTYAVWDRLRDEDPYDLARRDLAARFARAAWRHHGGQGGGVLAVLSPQERLVVVLRLYEGVAEEQVAALLGLSEARVRAVCARSVATLRAAARGGATGAAA